MLEGLYAHLFLNKSVQKVPLAQMGTLRPRERKQLAFRSLDIAGSEMRVS